MTSLKTLIEAFNADRNRGYYQGRQAYEAWMKGLSDDSAFNISDDKDNVLRRLGVNDNMLFHLIDARRAAEKYLRENAFLLYEDKQTRLIIITDNYAIIHQELTAFYDNIQFNCGTEVAYNLLNVKGVETRELRQEQIALLDRILKLEEENIEIAKTLI